MSRPHSFRALAKQVLHLSRGAGHRRLDELHRQSRIGLAPVQGQIHVTQRTAAQLTHQHVAGDGLRQGLRSDGTGGTELFGRRPRFAPHTAQLPGFVSLAIGAAAAGEVLALAGRARAHRRGDGHLFLRFLAYDLSAAVAQTARNVVWPARIVSPCCKSAVSVFCSFTYVPLRLFMSTNRQLGGFTSTMKWMREKY